MSPNEKKRTSSPIKSEDFESYECEDFESYKGKDFESYEGEDFESYERIKVRTLSPMIE